MTAAVSTLKVNRLTKQERRNRQMKIPLQDRIRAYAFQHDCDLDEATYKVLAEIRNEIMTRKTKAGLYYSLFGTEEYKG